MHVQESEKYNKIVIHFTLAYNGSLKMIADWEVRRRRQIRLHEGIN